MVSGSQLVVGGQTSTNKMTNRRNQLAKRMAKTANEHRHPKDQGGVRYAPGGHYTIAFPPSKWRPQPGDKSAPEARLVMDHVYGYNGSIVNNVFFVSHSKVIYPVASMIVIHDVLTNTQDYYKGHNNNVTALSYNPQRDLAASGQQDPKGMGKPYICIWSPKNPKRTLAVLLGHEFGIGALSFSPEGKFLMSIGNERPTSQVFVWKDFTQVDGTNLEKRQETLTITKPVYSKGIGGETVGIFADPFTTEEEGFCFAHIGVKFFKIWSAYENEHSQLVVNVKNGVWVRFKFTANNKQDFSHFTHLNV